MKYFTKLTGIFTLVLASTLLPASCDSSTGPGDSGDIWLQLYQTRWLMDGEDYFPNITFNSTGPKNSYLSKTIRYSVDGNGGSSGYIDSINGTKMTISMFDGEDSFDFTVSDNILTISNWGKKPEMNGDYVKRPSLASIDGDIIVTANDWDYRNTKVLLFLHSAVNGMLAEKLTPEMLEAAKTLTEEDIVFTPDDIVTRTGFDPSMDEYNAIITISYEVLKSGKVTPTIKDKGGYTFGGYETLSGNLSYQFDVTKDD